MAEISPQKFKYFLKIFITVLVNLISPPPLENIWIYPSVQSFLTPPWKNALTIIFLWHFHSENVYKGRIERVYSQAKTKCIYLGKNIPHKIAKFWFLRIVVIIYGGKRWETDPSVNSPNIFEGRGGELSWQVR